MWSANRGARAAGAESAAGAEHVAHRLAVDVAAQNQVVAQSRFYPRRDRLPS
jgi:head-tail adaptor